MKRATGKTIMGLPVFVDDDLPENEVRLVNVDATGKPYAVRIINFDPASLVEPLFDSLMKGDGKSFDVPKGLLRTFRQQRSELLAEIDESDVKGD